MAATGQAPRAELDFGTWMLATFGDGIVEQFMRPYNEKVWAQPASAMSSRWLAERVSTVDWQQALRSVITRIDDVTWGPNNLFAFPSQGGTGEIYRRAAATIAPHIRYDTEVISIDPHRRVVSFVDDAPLDYEHLVWTGPLDRLITMLCEIPDDIRAAAARFGAQQRHRGRHRVRGAAHR